MSDCVVTVNFLSECGKKGKRLISKFCVPIEEEESDLTSIGELHSNETHINHTHWRGGGKY